MTIDLRNLALVGQIAQAAYGFFTTAQAVENALREPGRGDFALTQARGLLGLLANPFVQESQGLELRHHLANDATGFSSSLFWEGANNRYVLSIRGTEDLDDIVEDINRIGLQGYAGDQLVSLYRYYRRLTTPTGVPVNYAPSEISLLMSLRLGTPLSLNFSSSAAGLILRAELTRDVGESAWTGGGPSVLPIGAPLVVTGHSLGGHLALLFGRLFPGVTDHVYTYNAPGISLLGELSLRYLEIWPIDPSRVTNIASTMGMEVISKIWSKPGSTIGVSTEPGSPLYDHSIVPLTDALSLYGAIGILSPGFAADPSAIGKLISASSPQRESSLELTLDSLRKALGLSGSPTQIATLLADLPQREDYYAKLYAMLDGRVEGRDYGLVSLVGKKASEIAAAAESDISMRFALDELLPFAATNADYDEYDETFSGAWLASRAEMLTTVISRNLADLPYATSNLGESFFFEDRDSGLRLPVLKVADALLAGQYLGPERTAQLENFLRNLSYARSIVFGSDESTEGEIIVGLAGADRLFGSAYDDHLDGGAGADFLEGGAGDDELFGGANDDFLDGGAGSDWLSGGPGDDAYRFAVELDADTIVDRDGLVYVGTSFLTGGIGLDGGPYLSSDGRFSYAFTGDLSSGGTLVVNGLLRVEDFRNGDLGIRLTDGAPEFEGRPDIVLPAIGQAYFGGDGEDMWDQFPDLSVNTAFHLAGASDFAQDVYGGDDYFDLGDGNDIGYGAFGNDVFEGGNGNDFLHGGSGDDAIFGSSQDDIGEINSETAGSGAVGDWLVGGAGDDSLFGSERQDVFHGGAGSNYIEAGAGNDVIYSNGVGAPLVYQEEFSIDALELGGPVLAVGMIRLLGWTANEWPPLIAGTESLPEFVEKIFEKRLGPVSDSIGAESEGDIVDAGPGNDTVFLGGGDDVAVGGAGADVMNAGSGEDAVWGDEGDDRLYGGAGNDTLYGGDGADFIEDGPHLDQGNDVIDGGDGNDSIMLWGGGSDIIYGGQGNDRITVLSIGDSGREHYIDAGSGDDIVNSGGGRSTIVGGAGNDRLIALGSETILFGGDGGDFLDAKNADCLLDGGAGNDTIGEFGGFGSHGEAGGGEGGGVGVGGWDVRARWGLGYGSDLAGFFNGSAVVEAVGVLPGEISVALEMFATPGGEMLGRTFRIDGSEDVLTIAGTSDLPGISELSIEFEDGTIWDSDYIDSLLAAEEEPELELEIAGSEGDDLLYGSSGADVFAASAGSDWMIGDAGDDRYLYSGGSGFDIVEDFDATAGNADAIVFAADVDASEVEVFASGEDYILSVGDGGLRLRGAREAEGTIESVEFSDGTRWTPADLQSLATVLPENRAPEMPRSLDSVAVDPGTAIQIAIPQETIVDPDRFDTLRYFAVTADGERLPEWLAFDESSLTITGTPTASESGTHDLLIIAADSNGEAAFSSLRIVVTGGEEAPEEETPTGTPAPEAAVAFVDPMLDVRQLQDRESRVLEIAEQELPRPRVETRVGVPLDPLYREMTERFDVLLQVGRANLGERYAEAIHEFEERRRQRETPVEPPPPTEEEVMEWNQAMHAWHDRHPGFTDIDGAERDGVWAVGWGAAGGERSFDELLNAGGGQSLGNPNALPRLGGAARAPGLSEGVRDLR